ncbi:MAG: BrnT family toxin [bacterium]
MHTGLVGFEWDADKAAANKRKHGVEFADAATVLSDEMALTVPDEASDDEERFVTVGTDALGRVLLVVYAWRGANVRLISARKASRTEREQYEGKRT